jgi:dTDP-4-amino-4,6-dideoxygalactose transaminase
LYVIRVDEDAPVSRDEFIEQMARRKIGCSVHFIPLHIQPYWRDTYSLRPEQFPRALAAYKGAVSLPLYTRMTGADQARVVESIRAILSR